MEVGLDALRKPHVGILTMEDEHSQFRGNRVNFIDIIRAGQELGLEVFVLTPRDFKPNQQHMYGYRYDAKQNVWKRQIFPLPQVIYNRIPSRDDEMLPEVQYVIKALIRHPYIQMFNPAFFNKWTLFEWLKKSKTTRHHIPTTHRLTKQLDLKKLLQRHSLLYLKPERGKAGKGIMRLKRYVGKASPYHLSIQEHKKSQTFRYRTITKLRTQIKLIMGEENYIAQQGIVLARYQHRPFDLRVLVQKNKKGLWSVSGVGARIAGTSSITTHVPRGGTIDEPQKVLSSSFGTIAAKTMMRKAKKAALTIAKQVEKGAGHPLGEMSMDLGIDTAGHIWFFEANAKPMKFDEPDIRKKSLEQLLQYCLFLSKNSKVSQRTRKKTR